MLSGTSAVLSNVLTPSREVWRAKSTPFLLPHPLLGMVVGAGATHSSGNEISSTPTVMDLEYLGVIQWISNEWQTLGMHLLVPPATLTSFFQKSMFDTYECCVMVFQHWIDCGGTSDYPPTWQGVCDVLCDIEHVAIAKKLKDKLSMKGKEQWEHFDAYQKAIEEGDFVPMQYLKCYLVGIPGVGKTTTMRRLVKMPTEDFSESTTFKSHPMKAATTGIDSTESDVSCSNSESEISDDGIHSDDSDSTEEVHQKLREKTDVKVEQSIISITNCAMSLAKNELWDIIELYHCTHRSKVSSDSHEVPQQSIADNESAENSATNGRSPSAPSARDLPEIPVVANWKEVEDIISSEVPEDIRKIVNEFNKQLKEKGGQFSSSKDVQLMLMIDIGGQSAFLEMLPLLMKGPSIYLTFFKLSEDPFKDRYSDEFRVDQNTTCDKDIKSVWTVGDVIVQILSNVAMSRYPNKEVGSLMQKLQIDASDAATSTPADPSEHAYEHQACAFLIGTFKDKLKESLAGDKRLLTERLREINKSIEKAIRDIFGDFKNRFIAYRDLSRSKLIFTLDKFSGDKEMKELRSCLMKESEKMRNFRVPVRWLIFGLILRKEYDWITVEDCEHVAEELHIKRKDVKEVLYFLSSITGMLLYQPEIDDPALQNVVICNLQVIFTSISERIVGNVYGEFGKQKPRREYVKDIGRGKFLRNEEKEEGNSLEKSKRRPLDEESGVEPIPIDSLLRLLSYRNIIAPLSKCEYIMPAALDYCYTPKDIIDDLKKKYPCSNTLPCPLFIKFAIGCTPPGLFSCLITTLYKKVKDDVQNLVKRNFICFEEGGAMIALVACSRWYEVHVINYDFEIVDDLKQLCVLVKKTVLIPIKKVVGRLGFSEQSTPCQLKLYIKCWLQPDDPEHFIELEEKKSKIRECFYLRCESCRENIHDSCWISPNVTPKSSNGKESLCFGKPTLEVLSHHGVISKVHEKWHELGVEFGQGDYLEGYKAKALMNYHTCCTYVFKAWIDNDGTEKYPLTWQGVYNALKSIGHDGIAKKVLSDMNIPFNP